MVTLQARPKNESMPPKLKPGTRTDRVHFVAPADLRDRIDEWRSSLRPIPNFSQAARRLMEERLDQIERESKTKKKDVKKTED